MRIRNSLPALLIPTVAAFMGCSSADNPGDPARSGQQAAADSTGSGPVTGIGGRCLDVFGGNTSDGATVGIWDCNGATWQTWSSKNDTLVGAGGKCLDVSNGSVTNGARVQLWTCNGSGAQVWHATGGQFVNPQSGKCLDAAWDQRNANGDTVDLWDCWGGANQQWNVAAGTNPTPPPTPTGDFYTNGGQIYDPSGATFMAKGVNINWNVDPATILNLFPGINMVRYADQTPYSTDLAYLDNLIATMAAKHVVVEIEDHHTDGNAWENGGNVLTGDALVQETNWYASLASRYKGNAYVWFGTENEPVGDYNTMFNQQKAIYDAVRGVGNQAPLMLEGTGGGMPDSLTSNMSTLATLHNVVMDEHIYGPLDQAYFDKVVSTVRSLQTADGTLPMIWGEYGPSLTSMADTPEARQFLTAIQNSGYGSIAWSWSTPDNDLVIYPGTLTWFGQQVADFMAGK